ncbi:nucleoside-diphosphate-sugar epimerase [Paenibacillus cellulosilyticus]|uniref:Nucleoside-diphosphate-sugar epimerase n=1 Tax=Paenibacillus cellulosilyticus TaxID=375489 RepID=A0A2V2YV78_9BACL|nr:NAD(P)-dependent oxidoreductase [Paenibacillus cellulosilyticus]PWW04877.1 nucleoside-diphosphate-sugar epimerase [Paenibacillus cellulosilyticus]QKS45984.1 NAD(P)-dependent oxidoreductase [Paenibacillus cellulosilyticus]
MAKKVVVTGGSGMLGRWIVRHFVEQGYDVLNVDTRMPDEELCPTLIVNLEDLGQTYGALAGADAVVHMAAIPRAGMVPPEVTFRNNVMSTYNVLEAAAGLGIRKAVIASSESSYGICFAVNPLGPTYVPMDESHPQLPEDSYGLSKVVNEATADMFHRRTGMQVVSLRLGNVIPPEWYERFPSFIHKPEERDRILWSYIDTRDAAEACRLAIETDGLGSVAINLASDETSMDVKSRELMAARYPDVQDFRAPLEGFETLLNNEKAKKLLGWEPKYRWREQLNN